MTSITYAFRALLRNNGVDLVEHRTRPRSDGFLLEAYQIHDHIARLHRELQDVRPAYLSTGQIWRTNTHGLTRPGALPPKPMTDREREEIDAVAKRTLRELNGRVTALDEAEHLRRETETALHRRRFAGGLGGALGAWAAGGLTGLGHSTDREPKTAEHAAAEIAARGVALHRDGVLLYLRQRLEMCGRTQQHLMEKRLMREMEKNRFFLAQSGGPTSRTDPSMAEQLRTQAAAATTYSAHSAPKPPFPITGPGIADGGKGNGSGDAATSSLRPELIQMFEEQNQNMLQHMETELNKIRTAQKSLVEISELQNMLVTNLSMQREQIDVLATDQLATEDNVREGNKQLEKATRRPSAAKYTFFTAAGLCTFLVIWDLLI